MLKKVIKYLLILSSEIKKQTIQVNKNAVLTINDANGRISESSSLYVSGGGKVVAKADNIFS